jgi:hypothetical protein
MVNSCDAIIKRTGFGQRVGSRLGVTFDKDVRRNARKPDIQGVDIC